MGRDCQLKTVSMRQHPRVFARSMIQKIVRGFKREMKTINEIKKSKKNSKQKPNESREYIKLKLLCKILSYCSYKCLIKI